jgi:hypothetical protein
MGEPPKKLQEETEKAIQNEKSKMVFDGEHLSDEEQIKEGMARAALRQKEMDKENGIEEEEEPEKETAPKEKWPFKPYTVHIVPHSHDDVGWLKTINQYFYGEIDRKVQWANVSATITSVIEALLKNKKRKFSQVEVKFLQMWWDIQSEATKNDVKKLVKNG